MKLPDQVPVDARAVAAIAKRHGLGNPAFERLADAGIINTVYRLGERYALRVPRNHPAHIAQMRTEAIASPAALQAGLRTPPLVGYDDACDLLPVPYAVIEWVPGVTLECAIAPPRVASVAWRELGHDLALLHHHISPLGDVATIKTEDELPDPRQLSEQRAREGWFTIEEARWFIGWLERLAPTVMQPPTRRLLHFDTQATNVIVDPETLRYRALIDWGCAAWGDVARDFCMPLRAVPDVLAGHREIAPLDGEDSLEARILWYRLQMILYILPRGATPGLSWAEHVLPKLIDVWRFQQEVEDKHWQALWPQ